MSKPEIGRQKSILETLHGLRGIDPLKKLFWTELNYDRVSKPLARKGWSGQASAALIEDPVLFATGGNDFHVIYARLNSTKLSMVLERAVVSRLLRDHPYALFVFSNAEQDRWHFLNVIYDTDSTRRRLFRRLTVGPEERLRTTSERIAILSLPDHGQPSPLEIQKAHDQAFDVEAVQEDFFQAFAEMFHLVTEDISTVPGLDARRLAQLLLDRLLFLYFIQKKGWLNEESNYLYSRFEEVWRKDPGGTTYYSDVLYPLFLCLSEPEQKSAVVGSVPFLNGGLFEESSRQRQSERLAHVRIAIRNSTFRNIFDNLLERFNFTVTEDTPLDIEVAIDPEMLGKIFESLVLQLEKDPAKDLRKLTGSYYTPRSVVHFMCQEALKEHLAGDLARAYPISAESFRQKIEKLLTFSPAEYSVEGQANALANVLTEAEARILRQAILDTRICDPAVGSGAFPVGMLHEMVDLISRLDLRVHGAEFLKQRNYEYDLKKRIIEDCIYGVDIQDQAVRLCELRLWLSLVVDYQFPPEREFSDAIREVPSLPNLSYRIRRGDSLVEKLFGKPMRFDQLGGDAATAQLIDSIQADKESYFLEGKSAEKRRLELKILAKQSELLGRLVKAKQDSLSGYQTNLLGEENMSAQDGEARRKHEVELKQLKEMSLKLDRIKTELEKIARDTSSSNRLDAEVLRQKYFNRSDEPTFMWRLDFAEVFRAREGFDIVIANPPYGIVFDEVTKANLTNTYPAFARNNDIYAAFVNLSGFLLRRFGVFVLITPNTYLLGPYFDSLKRELVVSGRPLRIVDFGTLRVFPDPSVFTAVTTFLRDAATLSGGNSTPPTFESGTIMNGAVKILSSVLLDGYSEPPFVWAPTSDLDKRISKENSPLSTWCEVKDVGFNYWTEGRGKVRGGSIGSRVLYAGPRQKTRDTPYIKGGDIEDFGIRESTHFLRHDYEKFLDAKHDVFRFSPTFLQQNPKIVYRQTADKIIAAIDRQSRFCDKTVHLIVFKEGLFVPFSYEYLLGLLNSRVIAHIYRERAREEGRLFAQVKVFRVKSLPIPVASSRLQAKVETCARALESATLSADRRVKLLRELDDVVSAIYGVSATELPE